MAIIYQIHPQHGRHMALTNLEADANIKSGWKTVSEDEFYDVPRGTLESTEETESITHGEDDSGDEIPRAVLEELYETKFGKKPPANAKDATIKAKLEAQQDE